MAWTTPRTWTTGEIVTAANMNTHVRDNLLETAPAKITTLGDLLIGSGASAAKRLGRGSAYAVLGVNSGGTDLEWSTPHLNNYANHIPYAITGGTSTAYTVTLSPAPASMAEGFGISIKMHLTCGATPTLNVNSLGAKTLKTHYGNSYTTGELVSGRIYTFRYNGTDFLASSAGGMDSFFGGGTDGALNTTGDVTLTSTLDGVAVVKYYSSITINAGHTLTVSNPCAGLILYSEGDVVISGTIDMSAKGPRGARYTSQVVFIDKNIDKYYKVTGTNNYRLGGAGGAGGNGGMHSYGGNVYAGNGASSPGAVRTYYGGLGGGGGGGGGCSGTGSNTVDGGDAGGTSYNFHDVGRMNAPGGLTFIVSANFAARINGQGWDTSCTGGGGGAASSTTSYNAQGGDGSYSFGSGGGGGGGAYVTSTSSPTANFGSQGGYVGGFILIVARGSITVNSGGYIKANGSNGGDGGSAAISGSCSAGGGGGGGGSGGGVIMLRYITSYTNSGTVESLGGSGGAGGAGAGTYALAGQSGSAGSAGTINSNQIVP